jgi:hypothetical protein
MTEQPAHSPVRTDPCADCVVGRSLGFPRFVGPGVNGQDSPSVSTLKLLTTTALGLTSGNENARWDQDARAELGNLEGAPLNWTPLTNLRVSATAKKQRRQS